MLVLYHSMWYTIRRTLKSKRIKNTQLKFYVVAALPNVAIQIECATTKAADKTQLAKVGQHTETGYQCELKGG